MFFMIIHYSCQKFASSFNTRKKIFVKTFTLPTMRELRRSNIKQAMRTKQYRSIF